MLVLCAGMFGACSKWQYEVVGHVLERHRAGRRLGLADGEDFSTRIEPTLDNSRSSVLQVEGCHHRFAARLGRGQALGIYAYRDPRDVLVARMNESGRGFDEVVADFLREDSFWRDRAGMLSQSIESIVDDPVGAVDQMARHLGVKLVEDEGRQIADLVVKFAPAAADADGGRSTLTAEQEDRFRRICGPWLVDRGYAVDPDGHEVIAEKAPVESGPRISYAQNMEDVLLDRLFRGRKGTYMDVGANHPTHINSTHYFYLRGWRGVNVEPVRSAFDLFGEVRPEDLNLQVAVSDVDGELPFYEVADCNGLSSLSAEMAEVQRANGFEVIERVVPTWTVASLIDQYGLVPPDIFSLDVEGNEGKVLRGIPLATWQPKVFAIEATRPMTNIPCHQEWEPILLEQGYLFAAFDGINRFYLRGDLVGWLHHFAYPVNALDFYVKAETVEQRERADALLRNLEAEHRLIEETSGNLIEAKVALAELKIRFGDELEARHRDYLAWLDEREGWRAERIAWEAERQARQAERESLIVDREALMADRDRQAHQVEGLIADRDRLEHEVDALHGVIGRLEGAIRERDAEIDRTRTQLGPFLKLDRLGVVAAIQRKVRAHRSHPKA